MPSRIPDVWLGAADEHHERRRSPDPDFAPSRTDDQPDVRGCDQDKAFTHGAAMTHAADAADAVEAAGSRHGVPRWALLLRVALTLAVGFLLGSLALRAWPGTSESAAEEEVVVVTAQDTKSEPAPEAKLAEVIPPAPSESRRASDRAASTVERGAKREPVLPGRSSSSPAETRTEVLAAPDTLSSRSRLDLIESAIRELEPTR